jgi:hypothetical protein
MLREQPSRMRFQCYGTAADEPLSGQRSIRPQLAAAAWWDTLSGRRVLGQQLTGPDSEPSARDDGGN